MKLHEEIPFSADSYLAVRCENSPCANLAQKSINTAFNREDLVATYDPVNGTYDVTGTLTGGQVALRALLVEDRIIYAERKYFCERATEKTVTLYVHDEFGTSVDVSTNKVSCQYPILEIEDESPSHTENVNENGWTVTRDFPADPTLPKIYETRLTARVGETIAFKVRKP